MDEEELDTREYRVVVNDEEQYSVWFADREPPAGWRAEGPPASNADCLARITELWTNMRPRSLRLRMEADAVGAGD